MRENVISIIVPVYNVEKYLSQCMDSLINQTFRDIEIICVNDGSTDGSLEILEQYAKKDYRIKIFTQKNTGLSGARNTGIEHATGCYTMFVDSDDWIDLDTCENAFSIANQYKVDLVLWGYIREFDNIAKEKKLYKDGSCYFTDKDAKEKIFRRCIGLYGEELAHPEHMDSIVTVWGKLYRTSLIKGVRFVDTKEIGTEDALFNIYALFSISGAYYLDECKNHYRKNNQSSLTKGYNSNMFRQWQRLYDYIEKFIGDNNLPDAYQEALENRIALGIVALGLNIIRGKELSFFKKVKSIKQILKTDRYHTSYKKLQFKYFPLHWKVFFSFAKCKFATGMYILLIGIDKMIGK